MEPDAHAARAITIGRTDDVTTLNPVLYGDLATGEVVNRVFDHLVLTDPDGGYIPGRLASHWETSADGLVWDFHLRPGARWHDGRPVSACDGCYTLMVMLDPETGSPRRGEFLVRGTPIRFEAAEPRRLRITLPEPYAPLLSALAWRPLLPAHFYHGRSLRQNAHNRAPIGNGAFSVAHWRAGDELELAAFPDYHQGRAGLDRVTFKRFDSRGEAIDGLLAGTVQYVPGVPPERVPELERTGGVRIVRSLDGSFTYLGFNLAREPFTDPRVRRALAHAIDRDRLVAEVLGGEGEVADCAIVPASPWRPPSLARRPFDPRVAGELLDAAGWRRARDGVRRADGRALAFSVVTVAGDPVKLGAARAIAADLERVGVVVTIEAVSFGELLGERAAHGRFDALLLGLTPGLDPSFLHGFYHSSMRPPAGFNALGHSDREVDRVLDVAQGELDPAARAALVARALTRIADSVPHVPLFHPRAVDAASTALTMPPLPATPANRFMYLHRWATRRGAGPVADRRRWFAGTGGSLPQPLAAGRTTT
jgi:peptide/nickel transport system substrate-binding protein